jgi:hypothetical protein
MNAAHAGSKGADDYRFGSKEYEMTDLSVKIVIAKNEVQFNRFAKANGLDPNRQTGLKATRVEAFSILHPREQQCTIYIKDPEWEYEPEFIGHELAHCVWGRWHEPGK